jgi:biopolymer transport protein ExbD
MFDVAESAPRQRLFYLRERFTRRRAGASGLLLQVAPWADVVLLALLFFLTQSGFVLQPGLSLDLPAMPMTGGARYSAPVVTIAREGMMFFNDSPITVEGLRLALARGRAVGEGASLVVEADASVSHRTLAAVYSAAIEAGVSNIVLATRLPAQPQAH